MTTIEETRMNQYLRFEHAGESYAATVSRVREIIGFTRITPVPKAPPAVRGVINLRGAVVPVIDLAVSFGGAQSATSARSCIVVVEVERPGGAQVLGVLADSVSEVFDLGAGEVQLLPSFGTRAPLEYLTGLARIGDRFVLILDIDRAVTAALAGGVAYAPPEAAVAGVAA